MESIIQYFEKNGIAENELADFLPCLKRRTFKVNEFILTEGQMEHYLSFVESGIVRYFILANNKETTFDFAFPNSFFCAYDSFYTRKPTAIYLQAITECVLYSISYENLQDLYASCEVARKLGQVATEYLLSKKVRREFDLLTKSPQERYEYLFIKQPKLIQFIPQKYIASYIGVVPETLSRIRKRIS